MAETPSESPTARNSRETWADPSSATTGDATPYPARAPPGPFPIVAIGASAGGLEALSGFLDALPASPGMAFIIVQHLDPSHPSMLVELLSSHTSMSVAEAIDGCLLVPDQIHVIPPGSFLSVRGGALHLSAPQPVHGVRLPFDFLLKSLAESCGGRTIGVVLSGSGADGSGALADLKRTGGFVIVQLPEEAERDGMPRSAIATGLVDQILPLRDIPRKLAELAGRISRSAIPGNDRPKAAAEAGLASIISFLNDNTAHDFRQYKPGTLERRIERRLTLLGLERGKLTDYLDLLHRDPDERDLLAKDLLINVTSFFRDEKVFETLGTKIIPDLIRNLPEHGPLRVWVAGCSSGEEAYSVAILCREAIEASGRPIKLQVFASDVDPDAIATAREGTYPEANIAGIEAGRLARFFVRDENTYRISSTLRSDVVFTVQDILSDPPFSRIDLVTCRNLLIYLNPEAQAKVIALFDFSLREGGILVLGSAETVGNAEGRFEIIAKDERLYRHIGRGRPGDSGLALNFGDMLPVPALTNRDPGSPRQNTLADICRQAVLASHAPAAVLINRKRQILYSMGPTERYLRVAPGYATLDVLAMATRSLRTRLRLAIEKASRAQPKVEGGRTRLTHEGVTIWFNVDVEWLGGSDDELLLICFVEETAQPRGARATSNPADATRLADLERELEATQAELQSSIQSQETSSQEQKAINEEAVSVNEEFQSTNEELLTSKEELQSLNEELTALNGQLQETLERQRLTSDDLQNVLYSTNVGTLFLDMELRIRFFTPAIRSMFNIISGDIGRPLADLRPIASDSDLLGDARRVLDDETAIEREVGALDDTWFLRRIFPYRAHDNRIEGVVITFADITERKITARALEAAKQESERANVAKSRFLAAASHDLRQPLQSLTLLQELLARTVEGEKPQKLLARLGETLGAMSGMLNTLLDINQIEAGVVEAKPQTFAISALFDHLRDEFTYLAKTRNLSLRILPSSALVLSDPVLLAQMIRNLLGNAIKYTKQGKVLLGCRRHGDALRIEVLDSGIGIAPEQLRAIFDEFHQVDNAARERSRGLGLGLSIVERLGNLLGHDVNVSSLPGRGSKFTITVPRSVAPLREHALASVETDTVKNPEHHRCKIVVVDDDPDVLELLEQMLRNEGHIVRSASDGAAALRLVSGGGIRPEILLSDYNLPNGMTGVELIEKLRAMLPQGLPAIILTGDISTGTLATIAAQDCIALSKPVKPEALNAAIERLLAAGLPQAGTRPLAARGMANPVVYVVDDDPEIRSTMREVLEEDGRTVLDFDSAEAFLDAYGGRAEGCLLIDAHMPGMTGIALLDTLRNRGDRLPTILITGAAGIDLAVEAMRTGACDFVEKPVGRSELLASVSRAIEQSHDIHALDSAREVAAGHVAELTTRQKQIMDLVLAGHPSKNIAADLGISQRTVENHRAAIMHRMDVRSLPELARIAQAAAAHASAKRDNPAAIPLDPVSSDR